ncbi:MAG: hypothetical protein ACYTFK_07830 [Planctomycetota bacterium]|jgi:hypothetical protein
MIAAVLTLLVTILCISHLYLKSTMLRSFVFAISAVIAMIAAFGYYEIVAGLLISRGYVVQWAQAIAFAVIFAVVIAGVKAGGDYIFHQELKFGPSATRISAVFCGAIAGFIISGILLIALALTPLSTKWPYKRFEDTNIAVSRPNKAILNADGIVASMFGWLSRGAFANGKSFSVYHADFTDQLHLNRHKASQGVFNIAAAGAVVMPKKYGVLTMDSEDGTYTVVRMGVKNGEISRGGATDKDGGISFTFSQVRLICKEKTKSADTTGSGSAFLPEARLSDGELVPVNLDEIFSFSRGQFENYPPHGRVGWIDLAFRVPTNMTPKLIEFKSNTAVSLPKAVIATEQIQEEIASGTFEEEDDEEEEE